MDVEWKQLAAYRDKIDEHVEGGEVSEIRELSRVIVDTALALRFNLVSGREGLSQKLERRRALRGDDFLDKNVALTSREVLDLIRKIDYCDEYIGRYSFGSFEYSYLLECADGNSRERVA